MTDCLTLANQLSPSRTSHIQVGDRITFRSVRRWSAKTETRVVNGFTNAGNPTVRLDGYSHFVVRRDEITRVLDPA